jgi:hypothetical protein
MKLQSLELIQVESRFSPLKYILLGALYGFLVGSAFVMTGSVADRLLHPDLPLGFDGSLFLMRWAWIAFGLAAVGAIASLLNEKFPSLIISAVVAGFVALVSALFLSPVGTGMKVVVLIFALIPMAALSLPVAWLLRWFADKHEQGLEFSQPFVRIIPLIAFAILLGIGSGYFLKMPKRAVQATQFFYNLLQAAPQDAKNPIRDLPGFESHHGMSYELFQKPSESSTEGFDVRAEYADGYSLMCVVVVYPGYDPYLSDCTSSQN